MKGQHIHAGGCNPLECIMPPHMLEAIRMRGTAKQRKACEAMAKSAKKFRLAREQAAPRLSEEMKPKPRPKREVYDAANSSTLPGKLVRKEGGPASNDKEVNDAFNGAGDTWRLYLENYGRDSLDGRGMKMISTVHYGKEYNNAFWNGEQMVYGDGDGVIFKALTGSRSVIGHELSHGVVQYSGGLIYRDQSGALNESFADVFGALTVQYKKKQSAAEADWLIGAEILGSDIDGEALRSMKAPGLAYDDELLGKDPQPFHMDDYVMTSSDNGGVHINSCIPIMPSTCSPSCSEAMPGSGRGGSGRTPCRG